MAKPPIASAPSAAAPTAWAPVASAIVAREPRDSAPIARTPTVMPSTPIRSLPFRQEPKQNFRSKPTGFIEKPFHKLTCQTQSGQLAFSSSPHHHAFRHGFLHAFSFSFEFRFGAGRADLNLGRDCYDNLRKRLRNSKSVPGLESPVS